MMLRCFRTLGQILLLWFGIHLQCFAQGVDAAFLSFNAFGGALLYGPPERQEYFKRIYRSFDGTQKSFDQLTGKGWCTTVESRLTFSPEGDPRLHDCETPHNILFHHVPVDGGRLQTREGTTDAIVAAARNAIAEGRVKPQDEQSLKKFRMDLLNDDSLRFKFAKAYKLLGQRNQGPWTQTIWRFAKVDTEMKRDGDEYVLTNSSTRLRFDYDGRLLAKEYLNAPSVKYQYVWKESQLIAVQVAGGKPVLSYEYANNSKQLSRVYANEQEVRFIYDSDGTEVGADLFYGDKLKYQFRYKRHNAGMIEHFERHNVESAQSMAYNISYQEVGGVWLVRKFARVGACAEEYSYSSTPYIDRLITVAETCPLGSASEFLRGTLVDECRNRGREDLAKKRLRMEEATAAASVEDPFEGDAPVRTSNYFELGFDSYARPVFAKGPGLKVMDTRAGARSDQERQAIESKLKRLYMQVGTSDPFGMACK